ncbi:MAG: hypothetical protein ACREPZ_00980 [Rhodanobacteraceae bacterium]
MHSHTASLSALITGALALAAPAAGIAATPAHAVYVAHLHAMNTDVTRTGATGEARFTVDGDQLTIRIKVHGAPADTVHWQHFHGFKDGQQATCAGTSADANRDGIVDLIETGKASGTTMVPFDTQPAAMDVAHGTYPTADADGNYTYRETVSLKALDAAFDKQFPGQKLDLSKRVVYIHGVPDSTKLPSTVASLGPIPAQVTLPIACGRIERVSGHASS